MKAAEENIMAAISGIEAYHQCGKIMAYQCGQLARSYCSAQRNGYQWRNAINKRKLYQWPQCVSIGVGVSYEKLCRVMRLFITYCPAGLADGGSIIPALA